MRSLLTLSGWFIAHALKIAGVAALGVFALALLPNTGLPGQTDQYAHASAFLVISFLFLAAIPRYPAIGLVAAIAMGGAIELLQMLVPGRLASFADIAANLVGIAAGSALFWGFTWLLAQQKAKSGSPVGR